MPQAPEELPARARQSSILTDRIANLPEEIDPKGLIEKLGNIQNEQRKLENEIAEFELKYENKKGVISTESLKLFRNGIKELIEKADDDLGLQSKIMKLIVHKIEVLPDGFEIAFHVGQNNYNKALEEKSSGASFFVSLGQKKTPPSSGKLSASDFKNFLGLDRSFSNNRCVQSPFEMKD